jgi:hypothetical protein
MTAPVVPHKGGCFYFILTAYNQRVSVLSLPDPNRDLRNLEEIGRGSALKQSGSEAACEAGLERRRVKRAVCERWRPWKGLGFPLATGGPAHYPHARPRFSSLFLSPRPPLTYLLTPFVNNQVPIALLWNGITLKARPPEVCLPSSSRC